jgi:hypothetical protein
MNDPATIGQLQDVIESIIKLALQGVGIAVVVMLLVGGFQYLSAGGDKEATARASRTLTFAIMGLVLALSSWIIMKLLGDFLGLDFSVFNICLPGQTC